MNGVSGELKVRGGGTSVREEGGVLALLLQPVVLVSALGYFVDIYDLLLFNMVRVPSLRDLGLQGQELAYGAFLHSLQMGAMIFGGFFWGFCADRWGRLRVLFGSILLYSVANGLNAFVVNVEQYAVCRFFAGVGLAGELGAAMTLVVESLPVAMRGYGTMLVASIGVSGAVVGGLVAEIWPWRVCYGVGGVLGLGLLALRLRVSESKLFINHSVVSQKQGKRTQSFNKAVQLLFLRRTSWVRMAPLVLVGVPIWYGIGILVAYAPELAKGLGIYEPVTAARGVFYAYGGLVAGDLLSGALSQILRSRRKALLLFLGLSALVVALLLSGPAEGIVEGAAWYYRFCGLLGFCVGYWAVLVTVAAESFGTNLRGTVATSVPNMIRGAVVPLNAGLLALVGQGHSLVSAARILGALVFALAAGAWFFLKETYGVPMDFVEKDSS